MSRARTETRAYLSQHTLEPLFKDMMSALLLYRPEYPIGFLSDGLAILKDHEAQNLPISPGMIFKELAASQGLGSSQRVWTPIKIDGHHDRGDGS
ncbi:hypothetical protein BJ684DRAFT_22108 [Piptocephalis cylindrospora]|uniref:Uncharacterized protein n=1 Tax=Piptocephalis cylindrospora TaxID=1907219 RepID=A0A4P9XY57_9FUNG|nr:hypothetical protein BJ684DRAFT_22108 [Piptocephalis cylindrospora]|eukprot:RKP11338.1 hypothetical protein BJ684DRAFT_22108 [Piptocephalis cylindrospora]